MAAATIRPTSKARRRAVGSDYAEVEPRFQGEIGDAVRSERDERRLDAERRGAGAALQAGARRGAALHRQRRYRAGGARGALRRSRRSSSSRSPSPCCCRSISPAPSRGRSVAWPRPPIACAAAMARQVRDSRFHRARGDEIGDLSGALREMTEAIWRRMDAIEHFAADVAHEIKNPLTSLRSAVETAARVEDPQKQRKLLRHRARGCAAARPADHRYLRCLAARCGNVARRGSSR